jgi:hypothetical protein
MCYLWEKTQELFHDIVATHSPDIPLVNDIVMGWDFLGTVLDDDIKEHDIVLMVSLDSTQPYESKESDCWMYIGIIGNLSPDIQYCKLDVLPGGFIPGPKKPKNVDSFLFLACTILPQSNVRVFPCGIHSLILVIPCTSIFSSQLPTALVLSTGTGWWVTAAKMVATCIAAFRKDIKTAHIATTQPSYTPVIMFPRGAIMLTSMSLAFPLAAPWITPKTSTRSFPSSTRHNGTK